MPKLITLLTFPRDTRRRDRRSGRHRRIAIAGVGTLGAAAVALSAIPAGAETTAAAPAHPAKISYDAGAVKDVRTDVTSADAADAVKIADIRARQDAAAEKKAAAEAERKTAEEAREKAAAEKAAQEKAAREKAAQERAEKESASRSAERSAEGHSGTSYPDNLDGWIKEALTVMKAKGIPGTYEGLHKNIIRESSGNPRAINNWDINAQNGIPSQGLLQVIPPTFKAYHVEGTSWDIYDPVANLTAAANYAADRYGSIDNVNSAY
ncbi:transglycosylase SLT domain-containing protein [Streptomyces sp. ZYX-F-203]